MSEVISFHPPLGKFSAIPNPNDPEGYLVNVPGVIKLAKDAGTPQGMPSIEPTSGNGMH